MTLKLLSTAAFAFVLIGAPAAFAQDNNAATPDATTESNSQNDSMTTSATGANEWTEGDRAFFDSNRAVFGGFFTDDSMSTARSQAEMDAEWSKLSPENQAAAKDACQGVSAERGKYSAFTIDMCAKIGG